VGEWIELANGGRAWRSLPASEQGSGVLLLHAWWGLNETFRGFADRLADGGFVVIAPDFFDGRIADTSEAAEQQVQASEADDGAANKATVDAALLRLRGEPGVSAESVGVVAASFGAWYATEAAATDAAIAAVVLLYGTGEQRDWSVSEAAFQGHYAENDPFETADGVAAFEASLRDGGRRVEFFTYPGTGHWFMEPDRADAYDAAAAELAWGRMVAFLRERLD
jgi:carboxymethylenebutenolidase